MIFSIKHISGAIENAKEIKEQYEMYVLNGKTFPRSVDDLLWICTEYLEKDVETHDLEGISLDSTIRGTFIYNEKYNRYEIYLSGEPTECKKRFVLCKELFHVLLDDDKFRNMDIYSHLENIMLTDPAMSSPPGQSVISEQMAEWAAMEFLFPYEHRIHQLASYHNIPDKEFIDIAREFMVPQYLVEKYLSEQYMMTFKSFYSAPASETEISRDA